MNVQYGTDQIEGVTQADESQPTGRTPATWRWLLAAHGKQLFPVGLLAVLWAIFTALNPRFIELHNLITILQQAVTLLVVALGMTLVIIAGSIDLSVGSILGLSTVTAASFAPSMGVAAAIPACLVGLIAGTINGVVFAKGKVPSFIVTLGTMVIYRGIILLYTSGSTIPLDQETFVNVFAGRSFGIPHSIPIAAGLAVLCSLILHFTVFGREVRAVGGGERVAVLTGIKVDRVKIGMFMFLGLLAGMAGVLHGAWSMAATSQTGEGLELDAIAAVVVGGTPLTGGMGSVERTVLGSLIMVILSNGMNMIGVDPYLQSIVKGTVLVAAVFVTIDRRKIGIIK
ncbi:MAG TPA: ABC transporter permease [Terriglobia bacterium]|nr:ABC transporter permease [Terriglobia bacterium]